ncbi:hypothetical protein MMC07_008994 [Pseudocyphellaria aurata]|nr:hypothetical protein [Pseudocyphellaria aurata]
MQSIRQYRRLGRRLRQQHVSENNNSTTLFTTQQDGLATPFEGQPLEKQDLEKADDTRPPPAIDVADATTPTPPTLSVAPNGPTSSTGASVNTKLVNNFSGVHVRDPLTPGNPDSTVYVVGLGHDDADITPPTWGLALKIWATFLIYLHGSVVGIASSIDSAAMNKPKPHFFKSEVIGSLAIGLFLIGFGFGALFGGPMSEILGRNPVFLISWGAYMLFIASSSLSPHMGYQLTFRFFAGFFGSAPLTLGGLSVGDLWSSTERAYTFPVFANAAIMGPVLGPVFGGYIGASTSHSWRWTERTDVGAAALVFMLIVLFQRETFVPALLKWKAKQLRVITGDDRFVTEASLAAPPFGTRLKRMVCRPFQVTATEPILILLTLWLTLVWIIMFTFLSGYKYIFGQKGHIHDTSEGVTGLCFAAMAVGLLLSSATVPLVGLKLRRDQHKARHQGHEGLAPESRLWYSLISAPAVPIALLWMAWTSSRSISIWSPLGASALLGYGLLGVFTSSYEYIIHAYGNFSGPALSFNTFTRYVVAGIMAEVAPFMWRNPGVSWTLTTMACVSAVLVPVPYIFFWYGPRIRARSRYAVG